MGVRCGARTAKGTACQAWAVRGTDPPRCSAHGGGQRPLGAPKGNQNAQKHGLYARKRKVLAKGPLPKKPLPGSRSRGLEQVIVDLEDRLSQLTHYIDVNLEHLGADPYARLVNLQGQLASRLGRLYRVQHEVSGGDDELTRAVHQALDELGDEWGTPL